MEIDEIDGHDGPLQKIIKKNYEMQEILIAERDKRNEHSTKYNKHSTKYNRGVNIIGVIDNCLGLTAIGLGIPRFGLLSTIVAAPAVIGIEKNINCYGFTSSCRKSGN